MTTSSLSQHRQQIRRPDVRMAEIRPFLFGQGAMSMHHRYFDWVHGKERIITVEFQSPVLSSSIGEPRDSGDVITELVAAVNVLRDSFELPELRRDVCLLITTIEELRE